MSTEVTAICPSKDPNYEVENILGVEFGKPANMEIIDVDYKQAEIDNALTTFDAYLDHVSDAHCTKYYFLNKIHMCTIRPDETVVHCTPEDLGKVFKEFVNDLQHMDMDWSFCEFDEGKVIGCYNIAKLIRCFFDLFSTTPILFTGLCELEKCIGFDSVRILESEPGFVASSHLHTLIPKEQKNFVLQSVPKFYKRYQTGKKKGLAYCKYGWNIETLCNVTICVSATSSNNERFAICLCKDQFETWLFDANELCVKSFLTEMTDESNKLYFPGWFKMNLSGYWKTDKSLESLTWSSVQCNFLGTLDHYNGDDSSILVN